MSIALRIVVLIGLAIAGLIGLGGFSLYQMATINKGVRATNEVSLPSIRTLETAQVAFLRARPRLLSILLETEPEKRAADEKQFRERMAEMNGALNDYEKLAADDKDRELLATDKRTAEAYAGFAEKFLAVARQGKREEAMQISASAADTVNGLSNALVEHGKYNHDAAAQEATAAYHIHERATTLVITAVILISLLVAAIGFIIYRHVAGGLGEMVGMFARIESTLDFTTRPPSRAMMNWRVSRWPSTVCSSACSRVSARSPAAPNRSTMPPSGFPRRRVKCRWPRNTRAKRRRAWRRRSRK